MAVSTQHSWFPCVGWDTRIKICEV